MDRGIVTDGEGFYLCPVCTGTNNGYRPWSGDGRCEITPSGALVCREYGSAHVRIEHFKGV